MTTPAYEVGFNPTGWQFIPFFDVLDFKGGNQPPKQNFIDLPRPGYVRLLQIRDFTSDEKAVYIQASKKWQTCSEEDILIGRYGASVGRVLRGKSGAYNVALIKMIIKDSRINREFLYYWLHDTAFQNTLLSVSRSAQNGFNKEDLKGLAVPVPPLAEQRRIVARIEALFARIRRARTDLERIAPLSRRHRDRTLVNTFDAGEPTSILDLSSSIFDGPFGSNLKSDDYTEGGTRVVRLENIGHLRFIGEKETFISDAKADGLRRHLLKPHDVLFSSFIDEEVRVCLLPEDLSTSAINKADCFCVRIDAARADPRYVVLRLASPTTYEDMRDAVHGATRPRIGITDLKRYTINVPSIAEQQAIAMRVERQHTMSRLIETEAARTLSLLDRLEQSILARAFRGELVSSSSAREQNTISQIPVEKDMPTTGRRKVRAVAA